MTDADLEARRAEVAARLGSQGVAVPDEDRWDGLRRPQLRYMLEGEDVAELHRLLEAAGVFDRSARGDDGQPDPEVRQEVGITDDHRDAWFGPLTERAVRAYQGRARLPQIGACDDATWLALYAEERTKGG